MLPLPVQQRTGTFYWSFLYHEGYQGQKPSKKESDPRRGSESWPTTRFIITTAAAPAFRANPRAMNCPIIIPRERLNSLRTAENVSHANLYVGNSKEKNDQKDFGSKT